MLPVAGFARIVSPSVAILRIDSLECCVPTRAATITASIIAAWMNVRNAHTFFA
jgi:hypothetical protein